MARNLTSLRFLAVSIAVHGVLLLVAYSLRMREASPPTSIPVSIFTPAEKEATPLPGAPRTAPERLGKQPTIVAKKESPRAQVKTNPAQTNQAEKPQWNEPANPSPAPLPTPARREALPERTIIAERSLPTIKELLPPVNWSSRSSNNGPVSLNTSDPIYVSYFNKIKQLIEANWEYPELALRYGLEGKLSLEFTIGSNGQLERARVIRSSGSQLLDDEAVRAIKAAAPFPPIPAWVKPNPLSISAAMEYHDNRIHYQSLR